MQLIAHRQIYRGHNRLIPVGTIFDAPDKQARELMRVGLAGPAPEQQIFDQPPTTETSYEVRAFDPNHQEPALEAAPGPFCNVSVLDPESSTMAAESNPVLSEPKLSTTRTPNCGRRKQRKREPTAGK